MAFPNHRQNSSNTFPPIRELSTGSTTVTSDGAAPSTATPTSTGAGAGGNVGGSASMPQQQQQTAMRIRSDSSGSMKSAFYRGNLLATGTAAPQQQQQQQSATNNKRLNNSTGQRHSTQSSSLQETQRLQQRNTTSSWQHDKHQDVAQIAAMAMVPFQESYQHTQQHPFQQGGRHLQEEAHHGPYRWDGMPVDSSNAELLLMMSSTQDSQEEGAAGMEGAGYGSIRQQSHHHGQWDSSRNHYGDPHDSASSPLLGAALTSFQDLESFGRQRPTTMAALPQPHPGMQAYSWIQQNQQRLYHQQLQQPMHQYQAFPESVFASHHVPPPPPPPLVSSPTNGKSHAAWSHSSKKQQQQQRQQQQQQHHGQTPSPTDHRPYYSSTYMDPRQQEEIALFSALATPSQSDYVSPHGPIQTSSNHRVVIPHSPQYFVSPKATDSARGERHSHHRQQDMDDRSSEQPSTVAEFDELDEYYDVQNDDDDDDGGHNDRSCWESISGAWFRWLSDGFKLDDEGKPHFEHGEHWTSLSAWVRFIVYDPVNPEFTSVHQAFWAVFIGIAMGFFTAIWKIFIDACVDFMWETVPETLLRYGILTDLTGRFPVPYYVVLCPAVCGCILSYITVVMPVKVPGQNEWIRDVHIRGVHDAQPFWYLFFISTMAMASGMSLGPEGPLVTLGGMFGSKLGLITKQSVLQSRVLNLTAASATVGGFFGFPMAGALFVLELPHRMGLQYFEALTPATVATIVAVLTNRMVMKNDVTGYYSYPFMNTTLPSRIFVNAICYGAFGSLVGIAYAKCVAGLKILVHDLFHAADRHHVGDQPEQPDTDDAQEAVELTHGRNHPPLLGEESLPLVGDRHRNIRDVKARRQFCGGVIQCITSLCKCTIPHEPTRAALVGTVAGATVGLIGMFLPHIMFWGEAQLQNLIDKGRTPLPVFVREDESRSDLAAHAWCMIDPKDPQAVSAGFSMGCSSLLVFAKMICTGLSMGTGIPGGHFWGPLFCGCAASHFLTDFTTWTHQKWGLGGQIAAYPCVSLLCVMGSTHVVTFRAHTAIMLILTLTISAFNPENEVGVGSYKVAGDYSAVFPLLVVAVYVSFILARDTVFYKEQRSRGDILALPEVLCEPGKVGQPLVVNYEGQVDSEDHDRGHDDTQSVDAGTSWSGQSDGDYQGKSPNEQRQATSSSQTRRPTDLNMTHKYSDDGAEVKNSFSSSQQGTTGSGTGLDWDVSKDSIDLTDSNLKSAAREVGYPRRLHSDIESYLAGNSKKESSGAESSLDELLREPLEKQSATNRHRRSQSLPIEQLNEPPVRRSRRPLLERSSSLEKKHRRSGSRDAGSFDSQSGTQRERSNSGAGRALVRVISFGELTNHQPSLLEQARGRSASNAAAESRHHRLPSLPKVSNAGRHNRWGSDSSSVVSATMASVEASTGALTSDDIERTFSSVVNQQLLQQHG